MAENCVENRHSYMYTISPATYFYVKISASDSHPCVLCYWSPAHVWFVLEVAARDMHAETTTGTDHYREDPNIVVLLT